MDTISPYEELYPTLDPSSQGAARHRAALGLSSSRHGIVDKNKDKNESEKKRMGYSSRLVAWSRTEDKDKDEGSDAGTMTTPDMSFSSIPDLVPNLSSSALVGSAMSLSLRRQASDAENALGNSSSATTTNSFDLVPLHTSSSSASMIEGQNLQSVIPVHIEIDFEVCKHLEFGQRLCLSGSTPWLGNWNTKTVSQISAMKWNPDDLWTLHLTIDTVGSDVPFRIEYKYVVVQEGFAPVWESGENHCINLADISSMKVRAEDVFESPALDKDRKIEKRSHRLFASHMYSIASMPQIHGRSAFPHASHRFSLTEKQQILIQLECYDTEFGDSVFVTGSIPELGEWNRTKALCLTPTKDADGRRLWKRTFDIPMSTAFFEYKYFILKRFQSIMSNNANNSSDMRKQMSNDPQRKDKFETYPSSVMNSKDLVWEGSTASRKNRSSMPFLVSPNQDRVIEFHDKWNKIQVRFSIYYPTQEGHSLQITGDLPQLGGWFNPGPIAMSLGDKEQLETDIEGRRWEVTIELNHDAPPFHYRYVLFHQATNTAIWEREPNRYVRLDDKPCVNSKVSIRDGNFVATMKFDHIPNTSIFLGPYPQSKEDIELLSGAKVTTVFNLQTEEDFGHRQIDMDMIRSCYKEHGIQLVHFPIRDFDRVSLKSLLRRAASMVNDLVCNGHRVYIHCTAGMGRAPTVGIAYLVAHCGWNLDDTISHVRYHHPVSAPNVPVLRDLFEYS